MNIKLINYLIYVLSLICLINEANLFYNMGIFVDEFKTSPAVVYGGDFWMQMDWLKLSFLALIVLLSGISLFITKNK